MSDKIVYRLIAGNRIIKESLNEDEVFQAQQRLSEAERLTSRIIPITESGSQFLLG
jgi:hypothetical protein